VGEWGWGVISLCLLQLLLKPLVTLSMYIPPIPPHSQLLIIIPPSPLIIPPP